MTSAECAVPTGHPAVWLKKAFYFGFVGVANHVLSIKWRADPAHRAEVGIQAFDAKVAAPRLRMTRLMSYVLREFHL